MSNEEMICERCKHIDPCIRMDAVGSGQCCYLCLMKKQTVKHSESCAKWESRRPA